MIQEEPITFEEYLSQKEQEAGQTFTQTRRDALREEFEQMLTAKQDKSLDPFEQFTDEQIALSVIPTQLKNSDVELKRILEGVRLGLDQGKSAYEIADNLMGYKIQEPTGFSNSIRQYISIGDLSTSQIGEVARLINNGNQTTALSKVESQIMNIAQESNPDSFISEGATRIAVEKTRDLTNLIDELDQSPIGVAKGTFSEWIGKFKGKEAQRIKTDVTSIVAEMRNRLSGTAVTENEQRFLEPLIPSLNDSPQNFMIKLNKLRTSPLLELNALRSIYDLPTLNERSLLDLNERVRLYGSTELKPAASELDRSYVESLGL